MNHETLSLPSQLFQGKLKAQAYLFKVNNANTWKMIGIYSKLTIKTPEQWHEHRSVVFIPNFEQIPQIVLVLLLLTLNMYMPAELAEVNISLAKYSTLLLSFSRPLVCRAPFHNI